MTTQIRQMKIVLSALAPAGLIASGETRNESEMAWIQNSPQTGYGKLGEAARQIQESAAPFYE